MTTKPPPKGGTPAAAKPTTRKDTEQHLPSTLQEAVDQLTNVGILSDTIDEPEDISYTQLAAGLNTHANKIINSDNLQHRKNYAAISILITRFIEINTKTEEEWKGTVYDAVYTATKQVKQTVEVEMRKAREEMRTEMRENLEKLENKQLTGTRQPHTSATPSWSDIVASTAATKANPHVAARAAIAARQVKVTLEGDSGILRIEMDGKELRNTLQSKLEELGAKGKVREIRKSTRDKTLLIEMWTDEAASELRRNILHETYTKALGIRYLPRKYALIVKFMPITCALEKEKATIYDDNTIDPNSVHEFRWMKPEGRRSKTQKVAHALLTLKDKNTANDLVARGMYIHSQYTKVERLRYEPMRCNKCQLYGHMARDCKQTKETCAYCGENHSSRTCTNAETSFCRPCNQRGHTATSRECPTFIKRCEEYNERNPINALPYFPTASPWTWSSGVETSQHTRSHMGTLADAIVPPKSKDKKGKTGNNANQKWSDDNPEIEDTTEENSETGTPGPTQ